MVLRRSISALKGAISGPICAYALDGVLNVVRVRENLAPQARAMRTEPARECLPGARELLAQRAQIDEMVLEAVMGWCQSTESSQ